MTDLPDTIVARARPKLLIVEDEAVVAMDLERQLVDMGYRVCAYVDNGADALARVRSDRPDLVLMDIILKDGVDGIAVAAHIGKEMRVPVLFLTAYSDDATVARAAGAWPYGYLTKPFQSRELRAGIEVALGKAEGERIVRNSERWLASVLRGVGDAVIATDAGGLVGLLNPAAEKLLGHERLQGRLATEVVQLFDSADGAPVALDAADSAAVTGSAMLVAGDGGQVPVDFSTGPIWDEGDHRAGTAIVLHDMRERVAAEWRLLVSERRFRNAFDHAPLGLALVGRDNRFVRVNRALCRLLDATAEQLIGIDQATFGEANDNAIEHEYLQDLVTGRSETVQYERRYRTRNQCVTWALVSASLLAADHEPQQFLIQINDVTERKRAEQELEHLAHHDGLTGVANRVLLNEEVEHEIAVARRQRTGLAVIFIDLDYFKNINDTFGHEVGDVVLKELAGRLTGTVRSIDLVGRMGGDEFVVVLCGVTDTRYVLALTDKLRLECARPMRFDGHEVHLAVSMGVSLYPDDAGDFRTLLRFADSALYHAKSEGRNNVQFYRPELTARMEMRTRLGAGLRVALERKELEVYYQPIVTLEDDRPAAAEALIRWNHPELGLLGPDIFLPVLEEASMGEAVAIWTLEQACRQAARWNGAGARPLRVGVNVTTSIFTSGKLVPTIRRLLQETGLSGNLLCIEITEQHQLEDSAETRSTLAGLRALGVLIAIDDFGTGYSSLSYISMLGPDELKIDKSLVAMVDAEAGHTGLLIAALAMARSLNLLVVSEGVETDTERIFLREHGCDMAQGYLYAHPGTASEFEAWIAARPRPGS